VAAGGANDERLVLGLLGAQLRVFAWSQGEAGDGLGGLENREGAVRLEVDAGNLTEVL
jgi:hypothetical protein